MRNIHLFLLAALLCTLFLLPGCSGSSNWTSSASELPQSVTTQEAPPQATDPASSESPNAQPISFQYAKSFLTEEEQELYDTLLDGILHHDQEIDGLTPDQDMIFKVVRFLDIDHPELFWFSGGGSLEVTTIAEKPIRAKYLPRYTVDAAQIAAVQSQLDAWTQACFATIPPGSDTYTKILSVYEYIIAHTEYGTVENNSIVNVMVDGRGLCGCYAKTTQYLLQKLGIPCTYVTGTAEGASHAWNLLWIDGAGCWLDTTWGDPVFSGGDTHAECSYGYFCITTADLLRTHTIDSELSLPVCTTETYNYFRHSGLYFTQYSSAELRTVIEQAITTGQTTLSIRYQDDAYPTALNTLFQEGEIYTILRKVSLSTGVPLNLDSSVWFSREDPLSIITLNIPY